MKIKNLLVYLLIVGISVSVSLLVTTKKTSRIAYVDSIKLLSGYEPLLKVKEDIKLKHSKKLLEIDSIQSALEGEILKFEQNKSRLSKKDIELQAKFLTKKQRDLARLKEAVNLERQSDEKELTMQIIKPIEELIKEYAKEHRYTVVFNLSGNLLYVDEATDITNEIIQYINENK